MKIYSHVLFAILLAFLSELSYAQAPVPFVNQPLVPDAIAPGGPQFTLTVNGTGFVANSVVNWNGNALATQFVGGSQLTATVPAADIAKASTASVTVVNPAPGGGTSNVAFFSATANTGHSVGFALGSSPVVGTYPVAVAVGDFNGDGKLDLAVAEDFSNTISILLGDGTGNFTLASSPLYAGSSVAVGDFNGDGKLDLALPACGNGVCILLGDGTGNFTLASSPSVGVGPQCLAVGDFNEDGKLDLAVENGSDFTISILLGDGTGNFTMASSPVAYGTGHSMVVGDFNGDGKLDLAVVNQYQDYVSVLLGDGTGNFILASSPIVHTWPLAIAVGDFNGDGKLDLAVTIDYHTGRTSVLVLLGDGTGNFNIASSTGVGLYPVAVAAGDFNGDGKLDLVTANNSDNTVSILLAGAPSVTLSPTSLTFGTQLIGTSSNPQPVTLTNIGSARLAITGVFANANFSQTNNCPRQVPPGGACTINVVFTPRRINRITGALTITDNAPNSPQTISLSGVGTAVSLSPSSLNFGSQPVGTTSQALTVTLTNYAPAALTIGKIQINPNFAQTNNCGTSVPAGGSCTISVTFTPMRKGKFAVQLLVYDNGGASPQLVSVSGIGT